MPSTSITQRGYTMIELMLTITVMSILLAVAIPSFLDTVRRNRLTTHNNEFVGSLNLARSEALKRSGSVTVCASVNLTTCSGATNWGTGWIVFNDTNANGTFEAADGTAASGALLSTTGASPPEFTLNSTNRSFVRFGGSGTAASGLEVFDLVRTGCVGMHARRINVSMVGRISTTTVACP